MVTLKEIGAATVVRAEAQDLSRRHGNLTESYAKIEDEAPSEHLRRLMLAVVTAAKRVVIKTYTGDRFDRHDESPVWYFDWFIDRSRLSMRGFGEWSARSTMTDERLFELALYYVSALFNLMRAAHPLSTTLILSYRDCSRTAQDKS